MRYDTLAKPASVAVVNLRAWIQEYNPVVVYACFSGGHDSLVSTHITMSVIPDATVLHIDTGIGVRATRDFVKQTCARHNWPLLVISAEECGQSYEQLVLENGFPGPAQHRIMFNRLKERAIYKACRIAKTGRPRLSTVAFVSGLRAEESRQRKTYGADPRKIYSQVWMSPIYQFTAKDKNDYMTRHNLQANPVVELLGMSGECLCGAYAHKGEKSKIALVDPTTVAEIERIEAVVAERGFTWGWEDPGPNADWKEQRNGQMLLFTPLCVGCEKVALDD
ncbi:MAG: phosphoadenosine phosphosulfate reductase family protein [Rhodothermales bacterium]